MEKEIIKKYWSKGVSLAGITSLLYIHGIVGIKYMELRKIVFKECQRLDTESKIKPLTPSR